MLGENSKIEYTYKPGPVLIVQVSGFTVLYVSLDFQKTKVTTLFFKKKCANLLFHDPSRSQYIS
jgi:hypothetical protein